MKKPFLTAKWINLLNITYAIDPHHLQEKVPRGVVLEVEDGRAFVSLVAFDFLDTRVFGIPWPGYRDFPELNLRFYVRYQGEPGVVFIKEYVPKKIIATLARRFYNEPYMAAPMTSTTTPRDSLLQYHQTIEVGGKAHTIDVTALEPPFLSPDDDPIHRFKEHQWGFGVDHRGRTLRYEVEHPVWRTYRVQSHRLDVDFGLLYGSNWSFLNDAKPHSVLFAEGSAIKVFPHTVLVK